jgi:hypothetical protein
MNFNDDVNSNDEKYIGFKNYCNSIKGYNQSSFDSRFTDSEHNDLNSEDKLFVAIKSIKDFNINDIVHNYHCHYNYTTVLEFILRTEKRSLIATVINKYINDIKKDIYINETLTYDLLTVLYSNLDHDNCITDTLTTLIFKFESLDFINVIEKFEEKLVILRYLINQKDNYKCSDKFLELIKLKYKEVLQSQEENIFKKFNDSVEYTQILVNNLISDLKYEPSEKMREFHKLIKSLKK